MREAGTGPLPAPRQACSSGVRASANRSRWSNHFTSQNQPGCQISPPQTGGVSLGLTGTIKWRHTGPLLTSQPSTGSQPTTFSTMALTISQRSHLRHTHPEPYRQHGRRHSSAASALCPPACTRSSPGNNISSWNPAGRRKCYVCSLGHQWCSELFHITAIIELCLSDSLVCLLVSSSSKTVRWSFLKQNPTPWYSVKYLPVSYFPLSDPKVANIKHTQHESTNDTA